MTNVNGVMLFTDEEKASQNFPYAVQKAVEDELYAHGIKQDRIQCYPQKDADGNVSGILFIGEGFDITLTARSMHGFSVGKRKLTVVASWGSFELGVEDGD